MTGFMNDKHVNRKKFIKGSGAVVAGLSLAQNANAATPVVEATGNTPFLQRTPADYIPLADPRLTQIDTWISITPANKVVVTHGETEFSGATTGILMLVAEELNITDMSMMVYAHPEAWLNSIGGGGGSGAISSRSTVARAAAAQAKLLLLQAASTKLGVPVSSLTAANGVISGSGGQQVKYSDLYGGSNFNFDLATLTPAVTTTTGYIPGQGNTKPVSQYQLVGKSVHRIDIPAKVAGTYTYVQNVRVPGMVHARRVRPRGAGANASQNHYPLSVDAKSIAHIPGAQVVQINNFLAVVAPKEYDAIQAAAQLKVVWKDDAKFPVGSGNYWSWLRKAGDTNTTNPARWTADTGGVPAAMASAAKTVSATYQYHYNTYVPIGPHCAVADVRVNKSDPTQNSATIYYPGQGTNPSSGMGAGGGSTTPISTILAALPTPVLIPQNQIRMINFEGSGYYGSGQLPQAAEEAAVISATIGKPVRMQWMRWDQTGWDSWGPSQMYDVTMGANAAGTIVAADWTSYGQAGTTLDTDQELLGQITWPAAAPSGGPTPSDGGSTATPYGNTNYRSAYQFQRRVLAKSQPFYGGALKSTALRAPNAPQSYFASEQIVDELAYALGMDPYAFRVKNIDTTTVLGARWMAALDAAVQASGYKPRLANSVAQKGNIRTGVGIGMGTFGNSQCSTVANVEVNMKTGKMVAKHLTIAQCNGITASLDGVGNQMSGAVIQGLSRVMWEQATWNTERVTNLDWVTYPILRFKDAPTVTIVNAHPGIYTTINPGDTSQNVFAGNTAAQAQGWLLTGSGEPPTAAVGSAMANAFFDATGARIRQTPLTPAACRGALKAAGVA